MSVIWNVVSMQRDLPDGDTPPEGLVTTVHWTATLGEAHNYGSVGLGTPDPDDYTPYDEITETQAVDWAKAALNNDRNQAIGVAAGMVNLSAAQLGYGTGCCACILDMPRLKKAIGAKNGVLLIMCRS